MRGAHPAAAYGHWAVVYAGDTQLLEPFDAGNDVDERIHGPHLMQRHPIGGQPMYSAFSLSEQLEGPYRPLSHPGREFGVFHDTDQLADVAMRIVVVAVAGAVWEGVSMRVTRLFHRLGGLFQ
jgi:hypothetical protein